MNSNSSGWLRIPTSRALRTPRSPRNREKFAALEYYPEAPELIFDAALDTGVDQTEVTMQRSTGSEQVYQVAGTVRIEVEGRLVELTLYQVEDGGDLFLPFRDATSGKETYGGGRYLEARPPHDGRVRIDFNYAYNPYCAYNDIRAVRSLRPGTGSPFPSAREKNHSLPCSPAGTTATRPDQEVAGRDEPSTGDGRSGLSRKYS